ncbi:TetR/AcrR family transcriptional regulator [Clostridium formicaceticum]|uniref:HTH-type transcriptional repressor AcnR n=1 Tax=Clostridium formicaceticum TaxID=1497 RepID=A0AAC9RQ98_9CLOT|nr:TetR/AcrR family transcriptional regulator [Clostridium formicaceticum]AOY74624.1 TetR family transcriptional regulator [Clostridium formicaceticum]ARE88988.1 HTH-type transcriptional repressor AcnR [Clostridium formicaceticum]
MPTKLYDKEQILNDCLAVFARHGYEKTSTVMLAEAAGISRALIFHHFKSKKELYLSLLDRYFEKGSIEMNFNNMLEQGDFFEVKEKISTVKFNYYKENPELYKVVMEAFYNTPEGLKKEIERRYGEFIDKRDNVLEQLFEKVPLREGVDREQAFKLIKLTLDYFENKYLADLVEDENLNEAYFESFIEERNRFFDMIRYGIQK